MLALVIGNSRLCGYLGFCIGSTKQSNLFIFYIAHGSNVEETPVHDSSFIVFLAIACQAH